MRTIRRTDRILDNQRAVELLHTGEYGFLAMVNADGGGYGIPISYAATEGVIYFHCAPEGHKLDNLRSENRVTFTVVGHTGVVPDKFTTAYESVMVFGPVEEVSDDDERLLALRLLVKKYSAGHEEVAEKYIKGSFHRTAVLKLVIQSLTAKAKVI